MELKTYTFHKDRVIAVVDADNGSETDAELEWIIIHYFEDEAAAEEAWPEYQKEGEAFTEAAIYLGYGSSFVYRKNGATIYTGTKSAVDAAE